MADNESGYRNLDKLALCYFTKVVSVEDGSDGLRIKAPIGSDEWEKWNSGDVFGVPYAFPLLPKMLHVHPKEGECVVVFTQEQGNNGSQRFFIGPIVPQDWSFDRTPYSFIMKGTNLKGDCITAMEAPSINPENEGTIPEREDVAIRGRGNSDIVFKDDEVDLRCGFKSHPYDSVIEKRLEYNSVDPAYIQMKYRDATDENGKEFKSEVNVVADRINLLSHDSKTYFSMGDRKDLINNEELEKVYQQAHRLPYGDELVAFLKEFVRVFKDHTHPFHQMPPCLNETDNDAISKDLDEILSKSIRIN